jgi:hypothetical protein
MAKIHNDPAREARRSFLRRGAALTAAGVVLLAETTITRRAAAQEKSAQNTVQYRDKPEGDKACANCSFFEAPSSCKVVAGTISPQGWCMRYAPKA